jgi:hypothetical protein
MLRHSSNPQGQAWVPPPLEHDQSKVTPPLAAQTTSGADAPTQDEVGGPPGFGPAEPTAVVDMFTMPPWGDRTVNVNDSSAARRLKSFTRRVLKKVDSSFIRELPPK